MGNYMSVVNFVGGPNRPFWLQAETFDRSAVNDRLALFAAGDAQWRETEKGTIRG
jgi:hypothetical protein